VGSLATGIEGSFNRKMSSPPQSHGIRSASPDERKTKRPASERPSQGKISRPALNETLPGRFQLCRVTKQLSKSGEFAAFHHQRALSEAAVRARESLQNLSTAGRVDSLM
jgi:hypothetical protein